MFSAKLKQQGAVLILMAFIIGLGTAAYLIKTMNVVAKQAEQDQKTFIALNRAKSALIAWSVSHEYSPGQMPWPDRNGDGNYDGSSDCVATPFQYSYLLGQLPTLPMTSPCLDPKTGLVAYAGLSTYPGLGEELKDAQGNTLWYAVSRNLVRDYQAANNPVINPGIINTPTYQWLEVLDRNGNLISNRVAAVIMAPGASIGDQDRTGNAPNPSEYLDSFQVGAATYSNRGYATQDEDFVLGEDIRFVSSNDPSLSQPYYFNDKVIYITIDELMTALEKRVGEVTRNEIREYAAANSGAYPFAAVLGGIGSVRKYHCINNRLNGALPVDAPTTCTNQSSPTGVQTSCSFEETTSIAFRKTITGNFNQNTPACTRSGRTCTCTGAGSCTMTLTGHTFSCNAAGICTSNTPGRIQFFGAGFTALNNASCTLGALSACQTRTITCNNTGTSLTTMSYNCTNSITGLPAWFTTNRWQDYVFYQLTNPVDPSGIALGTRVAGAVAITAGSPIIVSPFTVKGSSQVRPSCNVNDYLDSTENIDGDLVFDATNKQKAANYNDQTFVVAP